MQSNKALLVIDIQNGLFHADVAPYQKNAVLDNINQLIDAARAQNILIIACRHIGPDGSPIAHDHPNSQLIPELHIQNQHDIVIEKTKPSCFYQTGLLAILNQYQINELIITGMKTDFCIDTTCKVAFENQIQTILVSDAHTTVDNGILSANLIIQHHNQILGAAFSQIMNTQAALQYVKQADLA